MESIKLEYKEFVDSEWVPPPPSPSVEWEKLPPVTEGLHHGCLCCGLTEPVAKMDMLVCAGFGYAGVHKDGETVYSFNDKTEYYYSVQDVENVAAADPEHDWRIHILSALSEKEYQRQGPGHWVLVKTGDGFA